MRSERDEMVNRKKASVSKLPSPCISVCQMDSEKGVCLGCFRTRGEIAAWRSMSEAEQIGLLEILSERRVSATGVQRRRRRSPARRLVL